MSTVAKAFDDLLTRLGCHDSTDAVLISHRQEGSSPGIQVIRIRVIRKSDGAELTKSVVIRRRSSLARCEAVDA